jgi:hypothetical protein
MLRRRRTLGLCTAFAVATVGVIAGAAPDVAADSQTTTDSPMTCQTSFGPQAATFSSTVTDSIDPAVPGDTITYRFVVPFTQDPPPITARYRGGQTFYAIPSTLTVSSVTVEDPPGGSQINSTAAKQGNDVVVTSTANIPIDGSSYPTPDLVVTATVNASATGAVNWLIPHKVTATVDTDLVGTVEADCAPNDPTVVISKTTLPGPPNQPPVAPNQAVNVPQNTATAVTLNASDPDGDPLTYAIVTPPAHGTLTGSGPNRTFTPASNYIGPDSFTYRVTDDEGANATGVVNVTVFSKNITDNKPPVITLTSPVNGAVYAPTDTILAALSCVDATTSITRCEGTVDNGQPINMNPGRHSFAVYAKDFKRNQARAFVSYWVLDPTPMPQDYNATNTVPLVCDSPLANENMPLLSAAPFRVATSGRYTWRFAIGEDEAGALMNTTDLVYTFAPPVTGLVESATFVPNTGSANVQATSSLEIVNGRVVMRIAGPIAGGQSEATPFTPRQVDVVIRAKGGQGNVNKYIVNKFSTFDRTDTLTATPPPVPVPGLPTLPPGIVPGVPYDTHCTAGDPGNNKPNPNLSVTFIIDTVPPTISLRVPKHGAVYEAGTRLVVDYSCSDGAGVTQCTGPMVDGATLEVPLLAGEKRTFIVTARDAYGNTAQSLASYSSK